MKAPTAVEDCHRIIKKRNMGENAKDSGKTKGNKSKDSRADDDRDLLYSVEETPPWYLCILLGFQHYLTAFGSTFTVPLVLYKHFCIDDDTVGLSELVSTIFFVSGIATLIQTTIGVRLPIIQGATFAFLTPTIAIMGLEKWKCPFNSTDTCGNNITDGYIEVFVNETATTTRNITVGGEEHRGIWNSRVAEIQGAVMVASLFQVFIGSTGLVGIIVRFIGPLSIAPTITLIGLALFKAAADKAASQWWIALMTMFLVALFSQYLRFIKIPFCAYKRKKGFTRMDLPIFKLFPVLLAMITAWAICAILTVAGALPDDCEKWGYNARTDIKIDVLYKSQWFRFPYPGQWGMPTVSIAGVFGMLAGILASMVESVGDYFACARLSGAPPPPVHAVNRGIAVEGIGCMLAGAWGSGNGTTSYSENIGAIGITKVGSRRVVQVGGLLMILLGCFGKFGALFVTIPDPVVGGVFMITFGMITSVGLSSLQYVDMNSSRNIFILGTSLFFGLSFPYWMYENRHTIQTGNDVVDQIIAVLLSTSMFIGGLVGFVLDNTIPGTDEERGIKSWRAHGVTPDMTQAERDAAKKKMKIYDLPFIQKYLNKISVTKYIPVCPLFDPIACCFCSPCCRRKEETPSEVIEIDAKHPAFVTSHSSGVHSRTLADNPVFMEDGFSERL